MKYLIVALCSVPFAPLMDAADTKPNILFVIADDWGVHAGAYGTKWVHTPAVDRVAREGLRFTNAFTPMAKCAPSRAIILTGRHLWQNGAAGNHLAYFPADLKSWPEVLMDKGWHVGVTGKGWGPGVAEDKNNKPRSLTGVPYNKRKAEPPTPEMSALDYAGNFHDFLEATLKDSPWCFWYGCYEPHRGYEFKSGVAKGKKKLSDIDRVPSYWPDDEAVRHDMLDYAYEVEQFDAHLGRMLDDLKKRDQLDNTLVIVTSDHGMPFPRVKGYAYRDSNHVPLVIRWPAGIKAAGRVIDDFVDFTDIAPTVFDYASIDAKRAGMKPMTGRSWRPIFEAEKGGRIVAGRDHVLVGKERTDVGRPHDWGYPIRGIATADYLYLHNYEPSRWPAGNPETGYLDTDGGPTKSLLLELGRNGRADPFWKLNFGMRGADELFDLTADPDCARNVAGDPKQAARVKEMREKMERELREQDDPRMFGRGYIFDEYPATQGRGFYELYLKGQKPKAGWVHPSDFEKEPIPAK